MTTESALRAGWNELIAKLEAARDAIDDPKLYPPPPTDRKAKPVNSMPPTGPQRYP